MATIHVASIVCFQQMLAQLPRRIERRVPLWAASNFALERVAHDVAL